MAGSATLDPSKLLDSLIPVTDSLRTDLHASFAVRAYRIFTVHRTWSGREVGEGITSDIIKEIADPVPLVHVWGGLRYTLEPCGLDEVGQIKLTEWSLTHTEAEVIGDSDTMGDNQEWLIRLDEGHGQEGKSKYFLHAKPPYKDRVDEISWICWLRAVQL